jgi:hypothetical protein
MPCRRGRSSRFNKNRFAHVHDLVHSTPTGYIRRRVLGCWLGYSGLRLAQRLKGLPVRTAFSNGPLPAAIPLHGFNLTGDPITSWAHIFSRSKTRKDKKGQCQKKLSKHFALQEA